MQQPTHTPDNMPRREVYLDYAAATPMDPQVIEAMLPYLQEVFENPSAPYARARAARAALEDARARLAHLMGAKPGNIVLTAGATEANNLALAVVDPALSCAAAAEKAAAVGEGAAVEKDATAECAAAPAPATILTDAIEHESVLACVQAMGGAVVGVGPDGLVNPDDIRAALTPQTQLVSIELANGEVGAIQPLRQIAAVVAQERDRRLRAGEKTPLYLHTDASQAATTLSVNVSSLQADLVTLSAAKVYGPKQVGLLWAADGVPLRPLVRGGGQESGVRSGTENVAGAVAFARALELTAQTRTAESKCLRTLRDGLQTALSGEFPWMMVSGPRNASKRLSGLLSVSFPGLEARRLVVQLERLGVSVGTGSACAASRMRVSHVLQAMGVPERVAAGSLRITLGRPTTQDDLTYAAWAIGQAVREECARVGLDPKTGEKV